ncbi:hypothetical protein PTNB73_09370 [Pyrenophora teres f. teres]|uniref:DUF2414 domain containing protein n=2 Tax=Pyrenophora teres f. teres TaxID=97479 RepID=E3RMT5_PYRTT|nr:hypothetical protein PTT_09813 [Pyrenophora teres f. teres 0-1]KAE8825860.1 hypothetical protein HRS9139_08970 [Pyrenophora teres f. teres]CAA9964200.1 DUF2414 multi-domain protein [Pyrenophora teres f. maculata]KAE8834959.1 hypothetical protein PTNB85_06292 [Pyrenophora teres f. teres]KAE8843565.1 hypothetical protein HRS9122_04668 [Pyrenophora teres f. teres]
MDDLDMIDVADDIDIQVDTEVTAPVAQQPQQVAQNNTAVAQESIPAAYLEDIIVHKPWPESLNLQGVDNFDPNDPLYYTIEHCQSDPRVKQLRWVSDTSVNLDYYNSEDAALALKMLTAPEVGDTSNLSMQASRPAKPYSKKPDNILMIRQSNAGDEKPKGAAQRSNYYQRNPDVAGNRQRAPRRRSPAPRKDYLDYGEDDMAFRGQSRRRSTGDESMGDSGADRRGPRRNGRDEREGRDMRGRGRGGGRQQGGRFRSDAQNQDVDSYRPSSRSPNEPRFGRLRGRSASPTPYDDGDGRFGFSEHDSHAGPRRYRSRSRSDNRRRREPSADRWTHDRANYDRQGGTTGGSRWQKDTALIESSPMGNHHRSNAIDASSKSKGAGESLLSRMTKNGQPLAPQQKPKRSLADRITRDDNPEEGFGRLKNDYSDPSVTEFSEPSQPRRGLADRITRENDMNIRGRARSQEGINIRGSADRSGSGINIRGVASGA